MSFISLDKIIDFNEDVYRNIPAIKENPFDDLSNDVADWKLAESTASYKNQYAVQYQLIDYVFELKKWEESRYGDGSFPVWYGSLSIETTHHEIIHHWKKFLQDTPDLLPAKKIYQKRNVGKIKCSAMLLDLREKSIYFPSLISKNNYKDTQEIGLKLFRQRFPGLISLSARHDTGTNFAILNKEMLSNPRLVDSYEYQINSENMDIVKIIPIGHIA